MAIVQQNFAAYLRTLRIIFGALLFAQLTLLVVFYVLRTTQSSPVISPDEQSILFYLLPFAVIGLGIAGYFLQKKLGEARKVPELKRKLSVYRTAMILQGAALESATALMAVCYLLTGHSVFLTLGATLVAIFASQLPSRERIVSQLHLDMQEQTTLDDPNASVAEVSMRG